jgi:hypothetical protein
LTVAQFHDLRHRLIAKAEVGNARQSNQCLLAWAIGSFLEGAPGGGVGECDCRLRWPALNLKVAYRPCVGGSPLASAAARAMLTKLN